MEPIVVRVEDREAPPREYTFSRSPIRVGRGARSDLLLEDEAVSVSHGLIEFDARGARYLDLGSTNGTLVDGVAVPQGQATALSPDSVIRVGGATLRVFPLSSRRAEDRQESSHGRADGIAPGRITSLMRAIARAPTGDINAKWVAALRPGATIGRFELIREIGRGAFGRVFAARDLTLGRAVAFKAVLPGRDSQVRMRQEGLQKEAEALAQLTHPNIVTLHDIGACDGGPYLVFELLRGEDLERRLARGPLPYVEALDHAIEIAAALEHAHAAGLCHRDLKPSNVFVCSDGRIKVLDFGIAHAFGAEDLRTAGTPSYMAPEQWRGLPQDARTDVFAAAAMLFRCLAGRLPYEVSTTGSAALAPDARPDLDTPAVPEPLKRLLERALAADPGRRPEDGRAWLRELVELRSAMEPPPGRLEQGATPAPARARLSWWVTLVAVGAAAAALGALAHRYLAR